MSKPRFTPSMQWVSNAAGQMGSEAQRILRSLIDIAWNRTGLEGSKVVTGTAGTAGNISKWDANGDLVDGGKAAADLLTSPEFSDSLFRIVDNGDQSKKLAFEVSGITTATTRTWTVPDSDVTVSPFAATLLDDTTAGAALTTLGVSSYMQTMFGSSGLPAFLTNSFAISLGSVADDASTSVAITTATTGFLVLWSSNQPNLGGVLVGRTASTSNGGAVIAQTGTTQAATATSLNGTTGVDGQITFGFANTGILYFENRRGSLLGNVVLYVLRIL